MLHKTIGLTALFKGFISAGKKSGGLRKNIPASILPVKDKPIYAPRQSIKSTTIKIISYFAADCDFS